jgi:hypothetical protein
MTFTMSAVAGYDEQPASRVGAAELVPVAGAI